MELFWLAVSTIAIGVFGCVAWFWGSNWLLDRIYPPRGAQAGDNIRRANQIRPWLFLGPAILFLTTYLVYPVLDSFWRSLFNSNGSQFVGLDNYVWLVNDGKFRESMLNNMAWLLVVPALSTLFGLLAAQLTDRLKWLHPGIREDIRWDYLWWGELDMQQKTIPRLYGLAPGVAALTGLSGRGVPTGSMLGGILSEWALDVSEAELSLPVEPLKAAPFYMSYGPTLSLRYFRARDWLAAKASGAALPPHA